TTATDHQIKTNDVQIGDVFFTPSSETRDDIGHSAVVTEEIKNLVYSYHLIRFRIHENVDFDIQFRAYCFNSQMILREMSRLATGSTRYTLSIDNFEVSDFIFRLFLNNVVSPRFFQRLIGKLSYSNKKLSN